MTSDRKTAGEVISEVTVSDSTLTPTRLPAQQRRLRVRASPNKDIPIDFAPAAAADDSELISTVVGLVNKVYTDAENAIFHCHVGYQRTSWTEIAGFTK
ncbi:Uncharacterized protein TPAR_03337 [Tolypocladium paradoxum]|uniref:Uncharacterized protein n=1 Tax=Tolypocladium paradoxum TaxID=94208 RepID=A0A2S4L1Z7_9HYPO|nr:Uncharacterized protein TPAR_03337 [Tolypocladium paradoxum]